MMLRQEIRRVSLLVRSIVERQVRQAFAEEPQRDLGDPKDLNGSCGYASWALWKALPGSSLVVGTWSRITHSWVEVDGHIVDITATQFDFHTPARILVKGGKSALQYEPESLNEKADLELSDWYGGEWREELTTLLANEGLIGKS